MSHISLHANFTPYLTLIHHAQTTVFIAEITARAFIVADSNKRRTLSRADIAKALSKSDQFDFLIDIVPREEAGFPNSVNGGTGSGAGASGGAGGSGTAGASGAAGGATGGAAKKTSGSSSGKDHSVCFQLWTGSVEGSDVISVFCYSGINTRRPRPPWFGFND